MPGDRRHLGCNRAVRVVRSAEVATPCLAGLFRPVLLLPEREGHGRDDLPAILAHELAHARNHDLAWNLAAHLASIVLWFHPLAWRMRSAHAAACDAVSDAVAADYLGDVASYGRTLARLAVRAASSGPGSCAGDGPHVGRPAPARCPQPAGLPDAARRWRRPATASSSAACLLVLDRRPRLHPRRAGRFETRRCQAAKPANRNRREADAPRRRRGDQSADRGQSPSSIAAASRGRTEKRTVATGKDGLATIDYPPNPRIESFEITARKAGFCPSASSGTTRGTRWTCRHSKVLRFEPGTTIGGIVKDEAGHPIAGARVNVMGHPTECESMNHGFTMGTAETDAQGRWRLDVAPKDLRDVSVQRGASALHAEARRIGIAGPRRRASSSPGG